MGTTRRHFRIGALPLLLALAIQFLAGAGVGAAASIARENRARAAKPQPPKPVSERTDAGVAGKPVRKQAVKPIAKPAAKAPASPAVQPGPRTSPLAGKGMWIYEMRKVARGNPAAIAKAAADKGFSHIFVRVGSGASGLNTLTEASKLIVPAHERGLKVIAWYFPYFRDIGADVARSMRVIDFTMYGQRFDGFAADIEPAPGSRLNRRTAQAYSIALRRAAKSRYLVLVPPRVTASTKRTFPYWALVPHYDGVAPMVYWGRFDPAGTVAESIRFLAPYGKDIAPIGQAYDMGPEGGPLGNPNAAQTVAFMTTAKAMGSIGVSFWSWQHATAEQFHTIRTFRW